MADKQYATTDQALVAYLEGRGFAANNAVFTGRHVNFLFTPSDQLMSAIADYTANAPIPCRDYDRALREVRKTIRLILDAKDAKDQK